MQWIKKLFKKTFLYTIFVHTRKKFEATRWAFHGYTVAPPDTIKSKVVREYAERFQLKTFVETGTYLGQMIDATKEIFDEIVSIELDKTLFQRAKSRFSEYKNITILRGDSAELLPEYIKDIRKPVLFWLDAHYSAGFTAKGDLNTPINAELESILNHPLNTEHVILIDDARCFNGLDDYPTLNDLKKAIQEKNPNLVMNIRDDIIRIHKKLPEN
jgi:hypothetical protein